MSTCPKCQTELSDDFGLIDCPGCGAVLFVEIDGSVRAEDLAEEAPPIIKFDPPEEELQEEEFLLPDEDGPPDLPTEFRTSPSEEPVMTEAVENAFEDVSFEFADEPDQPLEVVPPILAQGPASTDLSNLTSEVADDSMPGTLRYRVTIQGIDTSDLRRELRDSLLDSKFGWDVDQLLKNIQSGSLEISNLSAVKAQIVIQRLKILPLKIRWELYGDG